VFVPLPELNQALKKVFRWDDALLPERENVIFYMNQPMHDDGVFETQILKEILENSKGRTLRQTSSLNTRKKIEQYKKFANLRIINHKYRQSFLL
jgi:hypothetical protein